MNWQLIKNVPPPYDSMIILYVAEHNKTLFAKVNARLDGHIYIRADESEDSVDLQPFHIYRFDDFVKANDRVYWTLYTKPEVD